MHFSSERWSCIPDTMALDPETLADLEGDAALMMRIAGVDDEAPPSMDELCKLLTSRVPFVVPRLALHGADGTLARAGNAWQVFVASDLAHARARWVIGHELAHWWFRNHRGTACETERKCDALGAMLVAPRRAMRRAVKLEGHRVSRLACLLRAPEALVLLRIGECTGRPVALVRPPVIPRGAPFPWPERLTHESRVPGAHPVRLSSGWGWMATMQEAA